jgi:hypothetical protein
VPFSGVKRLRREADHSHPQHRGKEDNATALMHLHSVESDIATAHPPTRHLHSRPFYTFRAIYVQFPPPHECHMSVPHLLTEHTNITTRKSNSEHLHMTSLDAASDRAICFQLYHPSKPQGLLFQLAHPQCFFSWF